MFDGLKPVQRRTLYDMYEHIVMIDHIVNRHVSGDTMVNIHGDSSIKHRFMITDLKTQLTDM